MSTSGLTPTRARVQATKAEAILGIVFFTGAAFLCGAVLDQANSGPWLVLFISVWVASLIAALLLIRRSYRRIQLADTHTNQKGN